MESASHLNDCSTAKLVSVIIPIYNEERYVAKAINSVLSQTYQDIEIVLINDGSSDGSKDIIFDYLNLPNVVYLEQSNGGVAAARNIGLRVARGELIAFLDQDDVWMLQKIELQAQHMHTHPKIGQAHANI
jgi:glycosyltransferase involved in cell wall biosynthesis